MEPVNTIRIAGIVSESVVDGPGIRCAIFTQGCPHHCFECHNPETWDFNAGNEMTIEKLLDTALREPWIAGVTLTGGEPFCQPEACQKIAKVFHQANKTVWIYTGYTWEQLQKMALDNHAIASLLKEVDVIVDGLYCASLRRLDLLFRGSTNQRILDQKKSAELAAPVLWELHND